MKVKDLIKELEKLDPNSQLILQKDGEGNGYSPLCGLEAAVYVPDSTYSGHVYSLKYTADDNCMEEEHWKTLKKSKENKCVVLYPVN